MAINGHLLLLIVAAGLFVRLWSTNDRQRPPAVWRTPSRAVSTTPPPQPADTDLGEKVPAVPVSITKPNNSAVEEIWTVATCPIPLPDGMAEGVYRVVDDTGRVARLEISAAGCEGNSRVSDTSLEFHATNADSRRWFFIRLQTAVACRPLDGAPEGNTTCLPESSETGTIRMACANRKFDFTGFDTGKGSDVANPANEFRPEPPALPVAE